MLKLENVRLIDLLPANLKKDKDMIAATKSIDNNFFNLIKNINSVFVFPNIDKLKEEILDALAIELHVDFYDATLEYERKVQLVQNSIKWHRQKGTPGAVQELIESLFGDGEIVEWFDYDGEPFFFKIVTTNTQLTSTKVNEFTRALESVKNVRSHLEKVEISMSETIQNHTGFVLQTSENITIRQVES